MSDERQLEVFEADWAAMRPHHKRGALFLAAPALDLLTVGRALRDDRADEVRAHLEAGHLGRPSDAEAEALEQAPETTLRFLIVQPYVVAQRL